MDLDLAFSLSNMVVLPAWALLIFAPGWSRTQSLVHALWIPVLLGAVYMGIIAMGSPAPEGSGFDSLDGVTRLFSSPTTMLAGWVHYLVFDLFVGAWEVRDARRLGLSHIWVVPCLVLTFVLGPLGLMVYLLWRGVLRGSTTLIE